LGFAALEQALRGAVARSAASVHIVGRPGGLLRLHGRQVVDAWTVGTPLGVPSPGRRARDDAVPRQPARFTAIADILFAIASGPVHAVWEEPDPPAEPDGIDLEHLLRETRRRLAVINHGGRPPLHADTLLTATAAGDTRLLSTRERMVLGLVGSGLIALRDIAFLVDRGLFAVTLDVRHLVETGLLEVVPRAARVAPRAGTGGAASGACDGACRCAARADGCSTGGPAPPPPDRIAADVVLGLFSRRRRQRPAAAGTTANGVAPQLSRRVRGSSGMAGPTRTGARDVDPERSSALMSEAEPEAAGQHPLRRALRRVLDDSLGIEGALVATTEGLLVEAEFASTAQVTSRGQAEAVAAMASAAVGIGVHFTRHLGLGDSTACVVQGGNGCIGVQRVTYRRCPGCSSGWAPDRSATPPASRGAATPRAPLRAPSPTPRRRRRRSAPTAPSGCT